MRLAVSLRKTPYRTLMMRILTGEVPCSQSYRTLLHSVSVGRGFNESAKVIDTAFDT